MRHDQWMYRDGVEHEWVDCDLLKRQQILKNLKLGLKYILEGGVFFHDTNSS